MRVFLIKSNIVISIIVSLLFLLLSGCANGLFYFPDQKDYGDTPKQYGQVYSEHYWQTEDGVKLHGWFIPAQRQGALDQKPLGTILFAHGNAGNITSHYWLVSWLPAAGVNLFIFDYRGFGQSEGIPTFKGTDLDTISAITYLKNKMGIESNKIMLLGQSLGGIV